MSHLNLETIARLVEESPDATEAAHLETCARCRTELAAMHEDVHALSMLPDVAAAPDGWTALERRLAAEGLIRGSARNALPFGTRGLRILQVAAALVLFLGGSIAGRATAGTPSLADADPTATASGPRAAAFASNVQPASLDEAVRALRETEDLYLSALTQYAELAADADPGDPVARLAALQSIILTTQAALSQTPADPVINGYHLSAVAQRDATLRQVAAASSEQWY